MNTQTELYINVNLSPQSLLQNKISILGIILLNCLRCNQHAAQSVLVHTYMICGYAFLWAVLYM